MASCDKLLEAARMVAYMNAVGTAAEFAIALGALEDITAKYPRVE